MPSCKVCEKDYTPKYNTLQPVCNSFQCMATHATNKREAKQKKDKKKIKRENLKSKREFYESDIKWWLQVGADSPRNGGNTGYWVHKWVRTVRDVDKPCPMCGSSVPKGGKWDACHYRSRGAAKQLRFEPDNIHKGCTSCNTRTQGDTGAKFRAGLLPRLGEERLTELDNDNRIHRWTIEECREIRDKYKLLCKEAKD